MGSQSTFHYILRKKRRRKAVIFDEAFAMGEHSNVFRFNFTSETILAGERQSNERQFYLSLQLSDSCNSKLKELKSPQESLAEGWERTKILVPVRGGTCFLVTACYWTALQDRLKLRLQYVNDGQDHIGSSTA